MNDFDKGLIGGVLISHIISRQENLSPAEQEIMRRELSSLSTEQLHQRVDAEKKEKDSNNTFLFWFVMFIGCFFFPWFCIPICLIGLVYWQPRIIGGLILLLLGLGCMIANYWWWAMVFVIPGGYLTYLEELKNPSPTPVPKPKVPMTRTVKWCAGILFGTILIGSIGICGLILIQDRRLEKEPKEGYCHAPNVTERDVNGKCWIIKNKSF